MTTKKIHKIGDITPDYFNYIFPPGFDISPIFPKLHRALRGLRKGELTMLTAGSGQGKSTFLSNLIHFLILHHNCSIADIKLEEKQQLSIYNYMALYAGVDAADFRENPNMVSTQLKEEFIHKFNNLYLDDHFGSLESNKLLQMLDYYASVENVDFIFLDHISIAISGMESSREGERKDIDKLVTKIRTLIDKTGVGVVCVSHLSNPTDGGATYEQGRPVQRNNLRGSASLAQLSDNIIAIEGNLIGDESDEHYDKRKRKIRLIKTRYGAEQEVLTDSYIWLSETGRIKKYEEII